MEKIATTLLHEGDRYYFQYRDGENQSGNLGRTGLFGGSLEDGETPQRAARRELMEEAAIDPAPELTGFVFIDRFAVSAGRAGLNKLLVAVYDVDLKPYAKVEALEGTLIVLKGDEIDRLEPGALSPVAEEFFNRRRNGHGPEHH